MKRFTGIYGSEGRQHAGGSAGGVKSRTAVRRALVTGAPQIMNVTAAQPGAADMLRKQVTG
jgi:hypothetical protein